MPISREPQVSDLGFCDRETAILGLAQHSPRLSCGGPEQAQLVGEMFCDAVVQSFDILAERRRLRR